MSTISRAAILTVLMLAAGACADRTPQFSGPQLSEPLSGDSRGSDTESAGLPPEDGTFAVATFAGGCFWSMEEPFEKLPGVVDAVSGYTGGTEQNPTYEQVAHARTGHVEAVRVRFDPKRVSYSDLLEVYWRNVDPTDDGGQFADRGSSYRTAIFVHTADQRQAAEASKQRLEASRRFSQPIVTPIVQAGVFYPAETYHQDFYRLQPEYHQACRVGSGRAGFVAKAWGADAEYQPAPPADSDSP